MSNTFFQGGEKNFRGEFVPLVTGLNLIVTKSPPQRIKSPTF